MNLRRVVHRWLALVRADRLDRDLDDEIAAHLELAEAEAIKAGMSREAARRAARLRFGAVESIVEAHRDGRSVRWIDALHRDARYGIRRLFREAGFTAVVVGVLALGIGATAAMFSLADAVLVKALPFPNPDRIMRVWEVPRPGVTNATSAPDFLDWRRLATTFEALSAERDISVAIRSGHGDPVRLPGKAVTADYFRVFGVSAERGRTFQPGDDRPGADSVIVLSHAAWETIFGGDSDIVGRQVVIDGQAHRVIGVLAAGAFDRDLARFWKPLVFRPDDLVRNNHWLGVAGRLAPGRTVDQARAQMRAIDAALTDVTPVYKRDWTITVEPLERLLVGDGLRRTILVAFGAAVLVLLIACANVANLLLAKGVSRQKELAVRAALGAGRRRLVSQLLTESFVLCALGGLAGIGVAFVLLRAASNVLSESLPFTAAVGIDWRVAGFVSAVVFAVAAVVGTLPSFQTKFGNLIASLGQSARGSSSANGRIRRAIVVGEVALSLMLVCGAGLLFRTLINLQGLPTGVHTDGIAAITASLPADTYPSAESASRFFDLVSTRLGAIPGVAQVALTTHLPLRWVGNGEGIKLPGIEPMVNVRYKRVDHGYFRAFDIPVIAGRGLTPGDRLGAKRVIVINETLAARLAEVTHLTTLLGQSVGLTSPGYDGTGSPQIVDVEIVGIVRNERVGDPWRPDPPVAYVPLSQAPVPWVQLVVRGERDVEDLIPSVRQALREIAPALPLGEIKTMNDVRSETYAGASRPAWTIGLFAAVAALLAALGLYGVLSHVVAGRRREIGIRMALGARAGDVVWHVLRDGGAMIAIGVAIGLGGMAAMTQMMTSLLYEVSPLDPSTLTAACVAMTAVGLLAGLIPASRAARVQPVDVLRDEG